MANIVSSLCKAEALSAKERMPNDTCVFENGLRVAFAPRRDSGQISIHAAVCAGVLYESANDNGVSHLLEHLHAQEALRTTVMRTQVKFCAWLDLDITHYSVATPKSFAPEAAEQLALALLPISLEGTDFEREKKVVIEEESRSGRDLLSEVYERLYPGLPLGLPSGGSEESLRRLTKSVVADYDKRFYHPANICVGIAGDVNHHEVKSLLEPFERLPECQGPVTPIAISSHARVCSGKVYSWETLRHECVLAFSLPSSVSYLELLCLRILAVGLDLVSSPLYKCLRLKESFYNFDATVYCFGNAGMFRVRCEAARLRQPTAVRNIAKAIARTKEESDEIEDWLSEAKLSFAHSCDPEIISLSSASYLQVYPLATSADGKYTDPETLATTVPKISNETIQAVARKYLSVDALSIFVDGPQYPGRRWWYFKQLESD